MKMRILYSCSKKIIQTEIGLLLQPLIFDTVLKKRMNNNRHRQGFPSNQSRSKWSRSRRLPWHCNLSRIKVAHLQSVKLIFDLALTLTSSEHHLKNTLRSMKNNMPIRVKEFLQKSMLMTCTQEIVRGVI